MVLTVIGMIQLVLGMCVLLFGGLRSAFLLLIVSMLFGGSASVILTALGGSSIRPAELSLLFVYLRLLVPGSGYVGTIPDAIANNFWLVSFAIFGIASAYVAPRMFAGTIDVFPMSYTDSRGLFDTVPLRPTSQNFTSVFYIIGTTMAAVATYIVCRYREGYHTLVSASIVTGWIHIAFGIGALITRGTPADAFFEFFRNGSYSQLDAEFGSFVRIRGIFPEASAYTSFAFSAFVLNAELWYRSIRSRATGLVACALAGVLFFSTSSTAYVGLGAYLVFWVVRLALFPFPGAAQKVFAMARLACLLVLLAAVMLAVIPSLLQQVLEMIQHMTLDKADSESGQQRLFWALQGWHAFVASYGLGIGPGSFRSSSFVMAMLGSMGVFGCTMFFVYFYGVFQPWRRSTWMRTEDLGLDLGGTFASAALLCMIPAAIGSPQPQPGMDFAIFAGAALAMRPRSLGRRTASEDAAPDDSDAALRKLLAG